MKNNAAKHNFQKTSAALLTVIMTFLLASCTSKPETGHNLVSDNTEGKKVVNLFGPMEKSKPNATNVSRSAFDRTVELAEKELGLTVEYRTYTAENYQEKTYDVVALDRIRHHMDDFYLLNPDTILATGSEGKLMDLSGLDCVNNLRDIVKIANTVDGKLVAIPQEFKENGIQTPVGANRWWLENFVFAQGYADLYNGGSTEAEIKALNKGETKYSDYMRPGFEFLKELIDKGYIDAKTAYTYEAIEGEGPDFLAQKTPIVMAYWGAANAETAYGKPDFNLQVIGFPSNLGQMPVIPITGYGVCTEAENLEDTLKVLDVILSDEALQLYTETNKVISPSKNVEVDCIPALRPLNDRIKENIYVLGSNAGMNVEQWGNTCLIVRDLLNGATVDECMARFDKLQEEALNNTK